MNLDTLIQCGVEPTIARRFLPPILASFQRWQIDDPMEQAAIMAQAIHESAGFVRMEENLRWRDPARLDAFFTSISSRADAEALIAAGPKAIANRIYANRIGNRDELSGDGWMFRGRGPFQLTGRDNYTRAGIGCHRPYSLMPELVATPEDGCMVMGWFWRDKGCGAPALGGNCDAVTRRINPGMAGAKERRALLDVTMRAFNLQPLGTP